MSLRVLKNLSVNDEIITALNWGSIGLVAGTIKGTISLWARDLSKDGGLSHLGEQSFFSAHKMAVTSIAVIKNYIISISLDGTIAVTNTEKAHSNIILSEILMPFCVAANEDKNEFYIATLGGSVYQINASDMTVVNSQSFSPNEISSISVHPASGLGCVLSRSDIALFKLDSLQLIKKLRITADSCNCAIFSLDGLTILVTTTEGTLRVVDTTSLTEVGCQKFEIGELNDLVPIDYGKRYIITGSEGKVGIFNLVKMIKEKGLKIGNYIIKSAAVQAEDMKIAVGGGDSMITLLDFD